jgi:hypothetical protein
MASWFKPVSLTHYPQLPIRSGSALMAPMPELTAPTRQQKITLGEIAIVRRSRPPGLLRGLQVRACGKDQRRSVAGPYSAV